MQANPIYLTSMETAMKAARKLIFVLAAVAALGGAVETAQANRTQVTREQYEMILACMKAGNSNEVCVHRVLGTSPRR
jgi:uncharacterized protein YgiB involved in biofilm formation